MNLLVATSNAGKAREFAEMFDELGLQCADLRAHPGITPPEETGATFRANACLKASYYAITTGQWTLADDSGLEVDAIKLRGCSTIHIDLRGCSTIHRVLNAAMEVADSASASGSATSVAAWSRNTSCETASRPGVYSARWAELHDAGKGDLANNALLLKQMDAVPDAERSARFVCVLALADPAGRIVLTARDTVEGKLLREYRGTGGFGYDPLFLVEELGRTTAELTSTEKHRVSHRGKAMRRLHDLFVQQKLFETKLMMTVGLSE